ncbi:MAG: plasmid stabilization protein [Hydrogenophilales bacterium 28-61-23]|nr:MAG: plasmid stabilization protein [Hydrogenophilales bacterium 28-61-23]
MPYRLIFTERYNKRAKLFLKSHPELVGVYTKTLQLLAANPQHPSLRLHALSGRLEGLHSVSINLSYRITLEMLIVDGEIIPINVGSHDAVYR